jgi:hypothetical protein
MVSVSRRRLVSRRYLHCPKVSSSGEVKVQSFMGGRRLGAWEAVVFGVPHVESASAACQRSGSPGTRYVVRETSVGMLVRLECVLTTLHSSNGRYVFHPMGTVCS